MERPVGAVEFRLLAGDADVGRAGLKCKAHIVKLVGERGSEIPQRAVGEKLRHPGDRDERDERDERDIDPWMPQRHSQLNEWLSVFDDHGGCYGPCQRPAS